MTRHEDPQSLRRIALHELLSSEFQRSMFPLTPIHQVAPNPHINIYRLSAPEGELFVKHYHSGMHVADEEYANYQYLKGLPFVPRLVDRIVPFDRRTAIFAYEYLDGHDMHDEFTERKVRGLPVDTDLGKKAATQFYEMDDALRSSDFVARSDPWALRSPVRKGFLPESVEDAFLSGYQPVFSRNQQALDLFPGYYFDRNPRNVMYTGGELKEVDYNVIEYASPLFDLAKFLRNGIDVQFPAHINFETIDEYKRHATDLNIYTPQQEDEVLRHAFELQTAGRPTSGDFEDFSLLFKYAAVHAHIFYLTKYVKMFREGKGDAGNLFSRSFYHYGMLDHTLNGLQDAGEKVGDVKDWQSKFIEV